MAEKNLTLEELKQACRESGFKVTGTKKELYERCFGDE